MACFGELLRRERELREISLSEVVAATKINLRLLEAIERNDLDALPGGLYNRGIVRAYCEFIGADADAMINAYLLEEQERTHDRGARSDPALLRGRRAAPAAPAPPEPAAARAAGRRPRGRTLLALALILLVLAALASLVTFRRGRGTPPRGPDGPAARAPAHGDRCV